jgi:hypothetical protein
MYVIKEQEGVQLVEVRLLIMNLPASCQRSSLQPLSFKKVLFVNLVHKLNTTPKLPLSRAE